MKHPEGAICWAPNAFRRDRLWPGVVVEVGKQPDFIKRLESPGRVCICFYGPSITQSRLRDYYWVREEDIVAWGEHAVTAGHKIEGNGHNDAFTAAHEEALSVEAGYLDPFQGVMPKVDLSATCCFSCGKPMKPKEATAAKEQQDRCYDCQALFTAGQHCGVCRGVWFEYDSHRLAECKRCGSRVHGRCDSKAAKALQAAAAAAAAAAVKLEDAQEQERNPQQQQHDQQQQGDQQQQQQQMVPAQQRPAAPYNCPSCFQKQADESRMDLLHLHAVVLADIKPTKPRAAAEIFAAEVARKHLASGVELDLSLLQDLVSRSWVDEEDKAKYEQRAKEEKAAFKAILPQYESMLKQYINLAASQRREVDLSLAIDPQRLMGSGAVVLARGMGLGSSSIGGSSSGVAVAAAAAAGAVRDAPSRAGGSSSRSQQQPQQQPLQLTGRSSSGGGGGGGGAAAAGGGGGGGGHGRQRGSVLGSGEVIKAEDGSEVPQQIPIVCNNIKGTFLLAEMRVVCSCPSCAPQPLDKRTFTPTQYEQHAGSGSAKKWKASLRIEPGGVPECPPGSNPMAFGKWLDIKGIEAKGSKSSSAHAAPAMDFPPHILSGPAASVKREPRQEQQRAPAPLPAYSDTAAAGGPSPCSSSRGAGDGAAAGGGGGGAAATSSGEGPRTSGAPGIPRNRRPDSWAPWEDVNLGNYKPIQVRWAGDRCCVCDSDVDYDCDRLVSCDGCGISMHQSCYGIPELPGIDELWLCRSCELKEPGAPEPQCCLCPLAGGGLKPTTLPGLWAHAACMQWIPEVTCVEPSRMEPIDRVQHIQKERWELLCCICRQRMGAKIQCNDCYQAYHPLCARRVGLHMEMAEPAVPDGPLQLVTYCPKHCKPQPESSGITLLSPDDQIRVGRPRKRLLGNYEPAAAAAATSSGSGAADPNNNNGLWNAQPFRANRPPAPIPRPPGGCARAAPFAAERIIHGTGTGCTSTAGFWIPTAATAEAAARQGAISDGGPCSSSTAGLAHGDSFSGAAAAGKPGAGRKRRRWGRGGSSNFAAARASSGSKGPSSSKQQKLSANGEPPPVVEMLPLPDGVPERLPVVCNGREAVFLVRAQRVLAGGQELTASRFEAMCGKGDAKKWKSSLWAAGEDGEPERCMGDWLTERKMDKIALAKLSANWAAVELRKAWEQQQQQRQEQQDGEGDEDDEGQQAGDSSIGLDGGATTEDGDEVTEVGTEAGTAEAGEEAEQQQQQQRQSAEEEAMLVDGQQQQQQEVVAVHNGTPAAAAGGEGGEEGADGDAPATKKQKLSDAEGDSAAAAPPPVSSAAVSNDTAAAAADGMLAKTTSNASSAMAGLAAAAAAEEDTAAVAAPEQDAAVETAEATVIGSAAAGAAAPPPGPSAAELRRQKGLKLLHRMFYVQLPDSFHVHPTSLPPQAAAVAAAATVKEQQQEQGEAGSATAAAAAVPAGVPAPPSVELSAAKTPWLVIGRCCRMYWPDDDAWYEADVVGYDSNSKQHRLWYHIDEVQEEIDLAEEEKEGRVQWLPLVDKTKWPHPPKRERPSSSGLDLAATPGQPGSEAGPWGSAGGAAGSGLMTALQPGQQLDAAAAAGWAQQLLQLANRRASEEGSSGAAAAAAVLSGVLAGLNSSQQQQGQGPAAMDVDDNNRRSDEEDDAEQPAASLLEHIPPGYPRLTAMNRDPTAASSVDLVALVSSGSGLQQQLQSMLRHQQEQYPHLLASQPKQRPSGQAAVGWRVGVFWPKVGLYYYGLLAGFDERSQQHSIEYDDGCVDMLSLQIEKLDWVASNGEAASSAGKQAHHTYMQQRANAAAAQAAKQQRKQLWQQLKAAQRAAAAGDSAAALQLQQLQQQMAMMLQGQLQQVQAELQQLGWRPGLPMPPHIQQRLQQLSALRQQAADATAQQQQQQQQQRQQQQQQQPAAAADASAGPKPGPKPGAPTQVNIICGTNTGVFDCVRMAVLTESGSHISPTEFERLSGKGSSKKWKCTLRVRKANGLPGITMGDWLLQMGYDQPKQAGGAAGGDGKASLNDIRRQQASRKAAQAAAAAAAAGKGKGAAAAAAGPRTSSSGGAGPDGQAGGASGVKPGGAAGSGNTIVTPRGVALHRDGCMCVICKQARRKAAQEAGLAPAPEDAYVPRQPGEGGTAKSGGKGAGYGSHRAPVRSSSFGRNDDRLGGRRAAAAGSPDEQQPQPRIKLPPVLLGKRAYVAAVPHLVRGAAVHKLWQIPQSRSYTPQEWEALQQPAASSGEAAAAAGGADTAESTGGSTSRGGTPTLGSRPTTPSLPDAAAAEGAAAADGDAIAATAAGQEPEAMAVDEQENSSMQLQQQQQQQASPQKQPQQQQQQRGSRTQTWREKLRVCRELEPKRITFGKSGIHGWGVFARAPIQQDSMVTDFRGQLVRCILADVREARYRKQDTDCYMFHAAEETVIDNTGCGNYSRFTNHCCAPCMYAKPLELGGELHLCFFARTDIKAGQELTFDYRFKEEATEDKVICQCAAPTCKGTLN